MQPLISVIVPVYGVEAYLDRCVESIVSQLYPKLEIILVDDGSPDSCPAMCDAWAARDSRIKVIHKTNGGLSDARNAGFQIATGDYISFVDSDDWIEPEFISALYNALLENRAEIAECGTIYVAETGEHIRIRRTPAQNPLDRIEALRKLVLEDGVYQTVWNKLYKRSVVDGIPFPKGKYNEDDFWTYQVFDRIETLALVERPLYNYLQRGNSIMGSSYSLKRLDGLEARFDRMLYLQKYPQIAALVREQFLFDCMYHCQCVLRCIQNPEWADAIALIQKMVKDTPAVPSNLIASKKNRFWLGMFKTVPTVTATLRNQLHIGV